jgi:hypothetical protein
MEGVAGASINQQYGQPTPEISQDIPFAHRRVTAVTVNHCPSSGNEGSYIATLCALTRFRSSYKGPFLTETNQFVAARFQQRPLRANEFSCSGSAELD